MRNEESEMLLLRRWAAVEGTIRTTGGTPETDLSRDNLAVTVRTWSAIAPGASAPDLYVFRLEFVDYDAHAPSIWLCNPEDPTQRGQAQQYYPKLEGNGSGVFAHAGFLCMPGDRRCYDAGHHPEWKLRQYFHPETVIESLIMLVKSSGYRGRLA